MKIVLICGSLELGRDGVGDYSYTLAEALRRLGVIVTMLALSDRHIDQPEATHDCLRIPLNMPVAERYRLASAVIQSWAPDWVSLQFVSWDFGWKGILGEQIKLLAQLTKPYKLHIMFHETWVGGAPELIFTKTSRFRRKILGHLQRASIKNFVNKVKPVYSNTSNEVSQKLLSSIGVSAEQLIMFSSIKVVKNASWFHFRSLIQDKIKSELAEDRNASFLIGIFGAIRHCQVLPTLLTLLDAVSPRQAIVLCLGASGSQAQAIIEKWQLSIPKLEIAQIGSLSSENISVCLQNLDVGISLHPASVIGRSSAAAAMLEHGVPVICPWGQPPEKYDIFYSTWQKMLYSKAYEYFERFSMPQEPPSRVDMVASVAKQMLTVFKQ